MAKQIPCPHCTGLNRLEYTELNQKPLCTKCKKPLFTGKPTVADSRTFRLLALNTDLPVVIDFWASWCAPCKQFAPAFAEAAKQLEPQARLLKVDAQKEQKLAERFGVRSLPTVLVLKGGKELARKSGAMPQKQLTRWLQRLL